MEIKKNNIDLYELYKKMPTLFKIAIWTYIIASVLNLLYSTGYRIGEILKGVL